MNRGLSLGCMYFGNGYREGLKMREFCQMGRDEVTVLEALAAAEHGMDFDHLFDADQVVLSAFWSELYDLPGVVVDVRQDVVTAEGLYGWTVDGEYLAPLWGSDVLFVPVGLLVGRFPHVYDWVERETGYRDDVAEWKADMRWLMSDSELRADYLLGR